MPVSPTLATHETPETPHPVTFPGDADPGGRDIVSATVMGAVASAQGRYGELAGDTYGQGSRIGDLLASPPVVSDWSKHTGGTDATSYDPAG
jgi:hypothetical protein